MAATIHTLFSVPADARAPAHPLLAELQETSLRILDEIVRRMFENADDSLFEMGEKAPGDAERRRYFDTMRVLRIDRNRVVREFGLQMGKGFASALAKPQTSASFDLDSLSIQPTEELEEKIALSNLAGKIQDVYKNLIWDLERRLEIAQARGVAVSPQALSPARICDAFGAATAVLDTDFQVKLIIFKLFDRVLSRDLEQVYRAAIALLEREGIDMRRPSVPSAPGGMRAPVPASAVSPTDLLHRYGIDPASLHIGDDAAAMQVKELMQTLMARGGQEQFEASAQRLSMAGQMFNEMLAEPLLSETLRSSFEPLRYPLYRTALTDPAFFTNAQHPARKMLADVVELAAATQTGEVSSARFRTLLQAMINQIDGTAAAGLNGTLAPSPRGAALSGAELDGFVVQLREQARARRNALLLHVRRLIAQELELRTVGREVPKSVLTLLRSGVGPLMAVRLLKHGRGSATFHDAEMLLDRIVATLEAAAPVADDEALRREVLIADMGSAFRDVGMTDERIATLLNGLRQTWDALDEPLYELGANAPLSEHEKSEMLAEFPSSAATPAAEAAPPVVPAAKPAEAAKPAAATPESSLPKITALELLSRVLTPESWFRVFDASQNQTRWLKLASFYANQDSVTFTGFDEATRLSLRASRLADDLVHGHSEPINPTASAREALEQLRQAKATGQL